MGLSHQVMDISSIHEMTEYLSRILNKSVIIENENFELIAYSSSGDYEYDLTQQKTILTKKCPTIIMERLKKDGVVQQLESKNDPIRVQPIEEMGFYQRVVIRVKYEKQTVGYIWVLESNHLLKEEQLEFLTSISSHVGKLIFNHSDKKVLRETTEQRLLRQLINHGDMNEQQIRNEAKLAAFKLPERFTVLVVSIADHTHFEVFEKIKSIMDRFQTVHKKSYLKSDFHITVWIGGASDKSGDSINKAKELIENIIEATHREETNKLLFGIGNEYIQLCDVRKSFLQALEVIEITSSIYHTEDAPIEYGKLGMYRFLKTLYEKNSSEGFINRDLLKLIKQDEENNSKLLKTLEIYLANNLKPKKTAKELFIHPNTLLYRMKQILEITEIDFEDFNMNCHLYTELLLLNNIQEYYDRYKNI
ncbi:helix-turn-helix domain-containing protein [Radiobacillus kanasensis]|uniref:PucR family transcriptional regulator n=1 Tax=Radiobacillus kanasensis TaxID=2844358 RepID=UPI001E3E07A5|nr:helix-turn-helix domain-containing protein [Radiobacillus kanasensis]UFT99955.1 helix-turn-helix domain-containing protein [Radiobacillus kanasensis]